MMEIKLKETNDYERLVKFFVENELEFDGDEEVDTDIIQCYQVTHEEHDDLMGGVVLAKREDRYIIDGIAVDPKYRMARIGEILLHQVIEKVKELDGNAIYLVARAPGFFKKNGFITVNPDHAPNFFECKQCPQYQVTCHPEVMKLEIK